MPSRTACEKWPGFGNGRDQSETGKNKVTNKIISDLISILAVVFLAMSVSPPTELVDKSDYWIIQQWKWIRTFDKNQTYPVSINPILLCAGVVFAVIGILITP
jgi:hypothetical protein